MFICNFTKKWNAGVKIPNVIFTELCLCISFKECSFGKKLVQEFFCKKRKRSKSLAFFVMPKNKCVFYVVNLNTHIFSSQPYLISFDLEQNKTSPYLNHRYLFWVSSVQPYSDILCYIWSHLYHSPNICCAVPYFIWR